MTPAGTAPSKRSYLCAALDGARMMIWGGVHPTPDRQTVHTYDIHADEWSSVTASGTAPTDYYHPAAFSSARRSMLIFGGRASGGVRVNTIHAYAPPTTTTSTGTTSTTTTTSNTSTSTTLTTATTTSRTWLGFPQSPGSMG